MTTRHIYKSKYTRRLFKVLDTDYVLVARAPDTLESELQRSEIIFINKLVFLLFQLRS